MPTNMTGARDEIMTMFQIGMAAAVTAAIISSIPTIVWDNTTTAGSVIPVDTDKSSIPPIPLSESWIRISMKHATGGQSSLTSGRQGTRYTRGGILAAQCFTPVGDGSKAADTLVQLVLDIFEGIATPSGVWFRHGHPQEIGQDDSWYQVNAILEFTYDQIK